MRKYIFLLAILLLPVHVFAAPAPVAVGMANPFVQYQSLSELKQDSIFTVKTPQLLPVNFQEHYFSMLRDKKMIEVRYAAGDQEIGYRMANITLGINISGDYTKYPAEQTIFLNSLPILARGDGSLIHSAIWVQDGYSYSLSFSNGISASQLLDIIKNIK